MKLSTIEVGQVYVIASNDWYASTRGHVVTRAAVKEGVAAVPALVLGIGKYRRSLQPCGYKIVENENQKGDTLVWVTYPKQRKDVLDEAGKWIRTDTWTWGEPFAGRDPWTDWEWVETLLPAASIHSLEEFLVLREERKAIALEQKATWQRIEVLEKEIAEDLTAMIPSLIKEGAVKIGRVYFDRGAHEGNPGSIDFNVSLQTVAFTPEVQAKVDELNAEVEKARCQR